jgi:hypothetical protein
MTDHKATARYLDICLVASGLLFAIVPDSILPERLGFIMFLMKVPMRLLLPGIGIWIWARRTGRSKLWVFLSLIPFVGPLLGLVLMCTKRERPPKHLKGCVSLIIFSLLVLLVIGAVLLPGLAGGPYRAKKAHQQIEIGMSVNDVVNILTKDRGLHSYRLNLDDPKIEEECARSRPEYENCARTASRIADCSATFQTYMDLCETRAYKPDQFVRIVNMVADKELADANYAAGIDVLFMGPGFLHNSFHIDFDSAGKVKAKTPVRHWD